jgi:hypothetical protein
MLQTTERDEQEDMVAVEIMGGSDAVFGHVTSINQSQIATVFSPRHL